MSINNSLRFIYNNFLNEILENLNEINLVDFEEALEQGGDDLAEFAGQQQLINLSKSVVNAILGDGRLITKQNILEKLDLFGVTDPSLRNSILALAGMVSIAEETVEGAFDLLELLVTAEGREKLQELMPPGFSITDNLTCITADCLGSPQEFVAWANNIQAIANNILQDIGGKINNSLEGDSFAVGQVLAEIALLAVEGDEVRFLSKTKFIDDAVTVAKASENAFTLVDDAGVLAIKKGDDTLLSGSKVDEAVELLNAPSNKTDSATGLVQKWDNPEAVIDGLKRVDNSRVNGVTVKHQKFPAPADGSDSFVLNNAKQYQAEASGDAALSFKKGDVSFDNITPDGTLVDRKYGHGNSVFNADGSIKNQSRVNSILDQGQKQVRAADGTPVRWEVSTELGADGIQDLFDNEGIDIIVDYVPQQTIIN